MGILDIVLSRPELQQAPPILIDVGASSGVNPAWKDLAKYSICVAFDPDDREIGQTRRESKFYRQLYVYKRALTSEPVGSAEFYLTRDAPCSSVLPPNNEKLSEWEFAERFEVIKKDTVQTIHLSRVLGELNLNRVDWFKTDSQGTDLRLFLSLGDALIQKVLIAEFEPGIIDAYYGDDKLWTLMSCMHDRGFWMSDIAIHGSKRIRKSLLEGFSRFERDYLVHLLKTSPGWAEVVYLNSFTNRGFNQRDWLLGWVCASIKRQHGFAFELAVGAQKQFADPIFKELQKRSLAAIRRSYLNLPAYFPLLRRALRRWQRLEHWQHPTAAVAVPYKSRGSDTPTNSQAVKNL
jgi:FkbM family methyltransferase